MSARVTGVVSSPRPWWGNADAAHGAGVDYAFDARLAHGCEQIAGAIDVGAVELAGIFGPEAVVGGHVEDQAAAGRGARQRIGIAQVPGDGLDVEGVDVAAGADERADMVAAFDEDAGDVPAEESGCAGDEGGLHDRSLRSRLGKQSQVGKESRQGRRSAGAQSLRAEACATSVAGPVMPASGRGTSRRR